MCKLSAQQHPIFNIMKDKGQSESEGQRYQIR